MFQAVWRSACTQIHKYLYVGVYVCACVCACVYVCVYVCVRVCDVLMYAYVYTC